MGALRSRTMPPRCKEVTRQSNVYKSCITLSYHLCSCLYLKSARLEREVVDVEAQVAILEHKLKQTRGHVERKLVEMRKTLSEMKAMEELLEVGQ